MRCPTCGRDNPPDARFCSNCGSPLAAASSGTEERRLITALFADLAGFTGLAESLDPEDLRAVVARFYALIANEAQRFGGTTEKYAGDAALVIFGLPEVHEDDAERAVRAALAMGEALHGLNADLVREGRMPLAMRIGINTGEVVADPRGGGLGEFHLAADAINVAARLQQHGRAGSILIGPRTERLVRGIVETRAVGPLELKGKAQPLEAWEVIGVRATRVQRGVPGRQAPLIGRAEEMDLLLRLYDRVARERRPHLVTVLGAPGVGKSRLQQEFLALLSALPDGPTIRKGRCLPFGDGLSFAPLAEILKQDAQIMEGDAAEAARGKLRAAIGQALSTDADRVAQALGFLIGLVFPGSEVAGFDPKSAREEAFAAWRRYIVARAAAQPLVLVVEDVHWADEGLLDLLDYTMARLHETPALLLCLARLELLERRPQWGAGLRNAATINLEPLSETESRALIAALLDVDDLPESVRTDVITRAEGNPFFVEEIVRMLMEQGAIIEDGGRWRATAEITTVPLPDTVQGVIAARLDRLPDDEKRLLQQAAVVGRVFWAGTLRTLTSGDGIERVLERLEGRDLVRERPVSTLAGDREYIFKHALTRDVAYATVPRAIRAPAHGRVAAWIEQVAAGRTDEVVDLLAHHWGQAGDAARAVAYLLRAGDRARQVFANRRAVDAYSQALSLAGEAMPAAERADVRRRRGETLQVLGQYDAAQSDFEAALEAARSVGDRTMEARSLYEITRLAHRRRDRPFAEIIAGYEDALRLAREVGDRRTEGLALTEIATGHWDESRLDEAARVGLQALEILGEIGDHGATAGVMNLLSMTRYMSHDVRGGLRWAEQALGEARKAGDRAREATALSYLGTLTGADGRHDEAERILDEAEAVAEEIGDQRRLMWVHLFRSFEYWTQARLDLMIHTVEAGVALGDRIGYVNPGNLGVAAIAHFIAGNVPRAREFVDRALAALSPQDPESPSVLGIAALLKVIEGPREDAVHALERAGEAVVAFPRTDHVLLGSWVAMGWLEMGEPRRAEAMARYALSHLGAERFVDVQSLANVALGRSALMQGRIDEAVDAFARAESGLGDVDSPLMRLEIALGRHHLAAAAARPDEADQHLREAERRVDGIRDGVEDPVIREQFNGSWIVSRVKAARAAFGPPRGAPARPSEA
ncbi:MAG TPA: adenylate/guanylate cyclase domain-containing protein [bacterium]|nr:adenylate/guanylate cyclase domain-containing protein [bacterium]